MSISHCLLDLEIGSNQELESYCHLRQLADSKKQEKLAAWTRAVRTEIYQNRGSKLEGMHAFSWVPETFNIF